MNELLRTPRCPFVVYNGTKKLVKRIELEKYIEKNRVIWVKLLSYKALCDIITLSYWAQSKFRTILKIPKGSKTNDSFFLLKILDGKILQTL